jgi:SAM-dependent methyltransferase
MKIHHEELSDVTRYLDMHSRISLDEQRPHFERIVTAVSRFKSIDESIEMLEIGTGSGWLPILSKMRGWRCKGLEISPQLIEYAMKWGAQYDVVPDVELGNLEDYELGRNRYDVIIASNVFEHVEHWREGVGKVYEALKPGGVMFFESTSKFSFTSGEFEFPLYGWMPNAWRYKLRIAKQGPDIMKLGIDFHQFTHSGLRREFRRAGFSRILDRVQMAQDDLVSSGWRKAVVKSARTFPPAKAAALIFADATRFLCFK